MLKFIKSPLGNAAILLLLIALIGGSIVLDSLTQGGSDAAFSEPVEEFNYKPETYERDVPRFKDPSRSIANTEAPTAELEIEREKEEPILSRPAQARLKAAKAKRGLPLNLFSGPATESAVSANYAPYGRLVPCELTITLESSSIDTPIIGLVTEDIVHAGQVIIPAGAEVHGRASEGRIRNRINASGTWNFVWRTQNRLNGTELTVEGIALDRELDFNTGLWGLRDGSSGLKGYLIKSDNWDEIKLFAATFLGAATQGLKDFDEFITDNGSSVQQARSTAGNAALDGTTAVLERYAEQISEAIARDGFYIRVPTGKQFYVYVTQTIDAEEGTRGNASNQDIWNQEGPNNEG